MKASASFATLALGATVLAQEWDPLPKRDVATIQNVIMQANTALTKLDTTVKAFNGGDFSALAADATNLKMVLQTGTTQIQGTSDLSANDAVMLQSTLGPVQTAAQSLVSDLKSKKAAVQQASLCAVIQQQTNDIGAAATSLIQATVMKVPQQLQAVATQLTSQFTGQLNDASLEFSSGNCTNAAGGAAAGIALSNGTASAGTASTGSTGSGTTASAATTVKASAFGAVVVAVAGFVLL